MNKVSAGPVAEGHEVSQDARLLRALLEQPTCTQRSLSRELGVALGLTNLLIKRLAAKGYVRITKLRARHTRYFVTAKGRRELVHLTRISMHNTVHLYTETRDVIRRALSAIAGEPGVPREVVFYGLGDVAEIAYVSLQSTPLRLIGAVDDGRRGEFFGLPIDEPERLSDPASPLSRAFIIVTTVRRAEEIRERLESLGVSESRVLFLDFAVAAPARPEPPVPDPIHVR